MKKIEKIMACMLAFISMCSFASCFSTGNSSGNSASNDSSTDYRDQISEPIDTDVYDSYMIADFESYQEIVTMSANNNLGTLTQITDSAYVKTGKQSLKIDIVGREIYGYSTFEEPQLKIRGSSPYVQKKDYSTYDQFRVSMYNAMDYEMHVQFWLNNNIYHRMAFWLKPGWNEVKIDYNAVLFSQNYGVSLINDFAFVFDRGFAHDEQEVVYIDNFRAVRTTEALPVAPMYAMKDNVIANFESPLDIHYTQSTTFGGGSQHLSYGVSKDIKSEGDSALRVYARGSEIVRTDLQDLWRFGLVQSSIISNIDFSQYEGKDICVDIYNNGKEAVTIYISYYFETIQTMGTNEQFTLKPGQWLHFKQDFSKVLATQSWFEANNITSWTGLMIGFPIPHPEKGMADVDLIVDNYRFEDKI